MTKKTESKARKKATWVDSAVIVAVISGTVALLGLILTPIITNYFDEKKFERSLSLTQTAEAKMTAFVQVFAITPVKNSPDFTPTPTIEVNASLQPTETPSIYADPIKFVRDYFSLINNHKYQEAWSKTSTKFKENLANKGGGGYDEYVSYWNTVDQVEIALIEIRSQSDSDVSIYAEIIYHYKAGYTSTGHTTYRLVNDASKASWLFDPN